MSDSAISDFMNITGCNDHSRAKFYIESSNGDLDAAVISFFESGGEDQEAPGSSQSQPSESDPQSRLGNVSVNPGYSTNKEGNEYYAGGAQSGIGIMGPPTGKPVDNDQFVKDLFKKAKDSVGAKQHEEKQREPRKEDRFIGSGFKLGGDGVESREIQGESARPRPKDIRLCMWKTGFTVDDGPLRKYDDPANQEFLDKITKGELPMELRALGTEINVSMEDRRTDSYEENKPQEEFKSFGGSGNRLGASESSTSSVAPSTSTAPTPTVDVDSTKPTTKLRIRLASGKQVVQAFNQSHTITDLKNFCAASSGGKNFELRAGFPPKPIDLNNEQTLQDAKLLNETVIQRYL